MVLQSVGLPVEGVALVAGVDRILDMMRTTVNVTGDAAVATCVDAHAEARPPPARLAKPRRPRHSRHSSKVVSADWIKVATPRRWLRNRHRATSTNEAPDRSARASSMGRG